MAARVGLLPGYRRAPPADRYDSSDRMRVAFVAPIGTVMSLVSQVVSPQVKNVRPQLTSGVVVETTVSMASTTAAHLELGPQPAAQGPVKASFIEADVSSAMKMSGASGGAGIATPLHARSGIPPSRRPRRGRRPRCPS